MAERDTSNILLIFNPPNLPEGESMEPAFKRSRIGRGFGPMVASLALLLSCQSANPDYLPPAVAALLPHDDAGRILWPLDMAPVDMAEPMDSPYYVPCVLEGDRRPLGAGGHCSDWPWRLCCLNPCNFDCVGKTCGGCFNNYRQTGRIPAETPWCGDCQGGAACNTETFQCVCSPGNEDSCGPDAGGPGGCSPGNERYCDGRDAG